MDQVEFREVARESVSLLDKVHDRIDVVVQDLEEIGVTLRQPGLSQERLAEITKELDGVVSETLFTLNRSIGAMIPLAIAGLNVTLKRWQPNGDGDGS